MNLYQVYVGDHEWCYFVFSTSRNRAKSICVGHNADEEYTELGCLTLKKDVGGIEQIVDNPEDDGYDRVTASGFGYSNEEEDL
jgi:hypothetical protein